MAGTMRAARLEPGQWILLAENKKALTISMRTIGVVFLQRDTDVPAQPADPDASEASEAFHYATVWGEQPRSTSYAGASNFYAFNPGKTTVTVEFEAV